MVAEVDEAANRVGRGWCGRVVGTLRRRKKLENPNYVSSEGVSSMNDDRNIKTIEH